MKKVVWIDPDSETSAIFEIVEDNDEILLLKNEFTELEAMPHEIQSLEDTYCCSVCGCIDIQEQGWFLVNKQGPTQITDMVENGGIWCPTCNAGIPLGSITCDKYEKSRD
jgi:hypothetical protein